MRVTLELVEMCVLWRGDRICLLGGYISGGVDQMEDLYLAGESVGSVSGAGVGGSARPGKLLSGCEARFRTLPCQIETAL